jgi:hypothetical protein
MANNAVAPDGVAGFRRTVQIPCTLRHRVQAPFCAALRHLFDLSEKRRELP